MANHLKTETALVALTIPEAVNEDGVTYYIISVRVGDVRWTVKHRYNDFLELHETLMEAGVDKESLPPKKLIGSRDPSFILKRRRDLETYLQSVFKFLEHSMPSSLLTFLEFPKYDINYILKTLAGQHYDFDVDENFEEKWTPLEMHSVSERLKTPRPALDVGSKQTDFANVADFCCRLRSLILEGSDGNLGTSSIIPNDLVFDFMAFKSLTKLTITDCNLTRISGLGLLRNTLKHLQVSRSKVKTIAQVLLLCSDETKLENGESVDSSLVWKELEFLDLRNNDIEEIDNSTLTVPSIETLLLSGNRITELRNLTHLPGLNILDLSGNGISNTDEMHTKLGQVTRINLSNNKIRSLSGFVKLYSLTYLNVAANRIKDLESVYPICGLPCLETLNLQGNKVTTVTDYRLKVFEAFGKRCSEITLDNESPSQSEVDRVSVLMALRVAREGKSPTSLFGNLPRRV